MHPVLVVLCAYVCVGARVCGAFRCYGNGSYDGWESKTARLGFANRLVTYKQCKWFSTAHPSLDLDDIEFVYGIRRFSFLRVM